LCCWQNAGAAKAASQQDEPPPGYLGIDFQNRSDGILVITGIAPDSPVHGAFEIMVGDVILEISGFNLVHLTGDQVHTPATHILRPQRLPDRKLTRTFRCGICAGVRQERRLS
jgi:predicted metalloprotease with PDZ domain